MSDIGLVAGEGIVDKVHKNLPSCSLYLSGRKTGNKMVKIHNIRGE